MKRLKIRKKFKLFCLGFIILCINSKVAIPRFIEDYKLKSNEMLVTSYIKGYTNNIEGVPNIKEKKLIKKLHKKYIGAIEIPSINLKQGLVNPRSKDNYVNKNIEIIKPYHTPKDDGKVMILASHSGTSKVAFFNKLKNIELNDLVYIYYENIKYKYKVINKYQIKKTGYFNMENKDNKTLLVLITCNQDNSNKQIVVICDQIT